ncbi:MAG: tetratricopeptide repeat protein [Candidatus Sulfotelmatobacter sp.]
MGRTLGALGLLVATIFPPGISGQSVACPAAMEMFRQRHWADAAASFEQCEKQDPGKSDALLYRGKALVNLRQFESAATALQTYAKSHPQSVDAAYLLAYIAFRQDKPTESLRLFADAAKLKAPTANDLTTAALDYVLLNEYNDAAHYLELSLKLDPADVEARYHLGRVRYQQNQFDLAIAAFQEVIKRDPGNVKAFDNLGLSLEAENQVGAATAAYKQAIELDEAAASHSEQPYLNLGVLLSKSNRFDEAIPLLARAGEIAPGEFNVHYELAKAYFDSTQWEPARRQAEEAVQLNPKDSSGHYLLARVYQRLGRKELAAEEFRRTSELIRDKDANSKGGMASGMRSR